MALRELESLVKRLNETSRYEYEAHHDGRFVWVTDCSNEHRLAQGTCSKCCDEIRGILAYKRSEDYFVEKETWYAVQS